MFSIGKMAQYCHTSIQTLRYYDQIGLLKPNYQDPQSKYRYYKLDQIFQFTVIKYLQSTNFSLEQIKEIMTNSTPDMVDFWKNQEQKIEARIDEEKKALNLALFQQKQFQKLKILKSNLDKRPYIREVKINIIKKAVPQILTPAHTPDDMVSLLDKKILDSHALPNLQYCFTFQGKNYHNLNEIHYLSMFKEISRVNKYSSLQEGRYLCVSFMWNRKEYLHYLDTLLNFAFNNYKIKNPLVIEESFPLNYNQQELDSSSNSITELRLRLE